MVERRAARRSGESGAEGTVHGVRNLEVVRSVVINRNAATVRQQFGDVAHHAEARVHPGVTFEILEDGERCTYAQQSSIGPLRLRQVFELDRTEAGPLVNRIVSGQFNGGTIVFCVEPLADERTQVEALLTAPLRGALRLLAPLLRALVGRQLSAALIEDKADLESGSYGRTLGGEIQS